jgi:hypothetical protein
MAKCFTGKCEQEATHHVPWPSGAVAVCARCARGWARIADAMGVVIEIVPLDVRRLTRTLLEDECSSEDK